MLHIFRPGTMIFLNQCISMLQSYKKKIKILKYIYIFKTIHNLLSRYFTHTNFRMDLSFFVLQRDKKKYTKIILS